MGSWVLQGWREWLVYGLSGWLAVAALWPTAARATHEADHRFTIDGFVCEFDGGPAKKTEVVVKDTRVNIGQTVETDEHGYYKVTLHLHNDNLGDPIVVLAKREEQRVTVQFDPNDLEAERRTRVNFGRGCVQRAPDEVPPWAYYLIGAAGVAVALVIVGRMARNQRRAERGKSHKKQRKS